MPGRFGRMTGLAERYRDLIRAALKDAGSQGLTLHELCERVSNRTAGAVRADLRRMCTETGECRREGDRYYHVDGAASAGVRGA